MSGYLVAVVGRSNSDAGGTGSGERSGFGVDSGIAGQTKIKACMDAHNQPITRASSGFRHPTTPGTVDDTPACTPTISAALTSARAHSIRTLSIPWIKFEQLRASTRLYPIIPRKCHVTVLADLYLRSNLNASSPLPSSAVLPSLAFSLGAAESCTSHVVLHRLHGSLGRGRRLNVARNLAGLVLVSLALNLRSKASLLRGAVSTGIETAQLATC